MGIGLINQQSAYFDVRTKKQINASDMQSINDRLKSFSITEEMNKIFNGTIAFEDPYNTSMDLIFHLGQTLKLEWGYKRPDTSLLAAYAKKENTGEITGQLNRSNVDAFVLSPSGGGDSEGRISYDCNFMGWGYKSGKRQKIYNNMTRGQVVQEVLTTMGIPPSNQLVNFGQRQNDKLSEDTYIIQHESNFQFLNRMSFENACVFSIGQGRKGTFGLFANYTTNECEKFQNLVAGAVGNSITLNYKYGFPNVESYTWQQSAGDSTGDSVQIMTINGQPTFRRFNADTQKIQDYKINTEKIKKDIQSKSGLGAKVKFSSELMKIDRFDELLKNNYFYPVIETTAPQGYGWSFKVRMLGNPLMTAPMKVIFGNGFPNMFGKNKTTDKRNFWVRSVTHTIDANGYHCDLDIVDALTLAGGTYVM